MCAVAHILWKAQLLQCGSTDNELVSRTCCESFPELSQLFCGK